jgi:hypothetical protein
LAFWDHPAWVPDLPSFHCQTVQDCRLQLPPGARCVHLPMPSAPTLAIDEREESLGAPTLRLNQFRAGPNFGGSSVRFGYGPPARSPPGLTRPRRFNTRLAAWGFYVRASRRQVSPATAGYSYGATWGLAPTGLAPASLTVSFAALPPPGPRARVPRLLRYYGALRFPGDRLAALRWPSLGDTTPCAWVRLSRQARRRPGARGFAVWQPPRQRFSRWSRRASQVPGGPRCACAVFFDPGGTGPPGRNRVVRRGPRADKTEGSPRVGISGLHSTAWTLAVYASSGGLPHRDARLASGCWPGSTGWDWLPTRSLRKVLKVPSLHSSPPSPSFAWRNARNQYCEFCNRDNRFLSPPLRPSPWPSGVEPRWSAVPRRRRSRPSAR